MFKKFAFSEKGMNRSEFSDQLTQKTALICFVNVDFNEVLKVHRQLVDMSSNRVISLFAVQVDGCWEVR